MSKSVLIIGDINNSSVQKKIIELIKPLKDIEESFDELLKSNNICYLTNQVTKLIVSDIELYQDFFTHTNLTSNCKIGIIEDFSSVSKIQQNKLLKTIEENTTNTIHIFVAQNTSNILPTILSRVYTINLSLVNLSYPNEHEFYPLIIQQQNELNYLLDNDILATKTIKIFELYEKAEYEKAYLIFCNNEFKKINLTLATIIYRIIVTTLKRQEYYQLTKEILELEQRIYANININLQLEAIMVLVIKELG